MTSFTASVTRSALGLPSLNINDGVNYKIGGEIMGGTVQWERKTVSSPFVHGDFTVLRRLQNVSERIPIYVYGSSQTTMVTNARALIDAFIQPLFNLTMTLDAQTYTYQCEAADYTYQWSNAHMFSGQVVIEFQVPRMPLALVGI